MGYLKMEYYLATKDDDESKYLLIGRLWCKFFEIKKKTLEIIWAGTIQFFNINICIGTEKALQWPKNVNAKYFLI